MGETVTREKQISFTVLIQNKIEAIEGLVVDANIEYHDACVKKYGLHCETCYEVAMSNALRIQKTL